MADDAPQPNPELIALLRGALAHAEAGRLTDGVFVGVGPEITHCGFEVKNAASAVIGELFCMQGNIAGLIGNARAQARGLVRPGRLLHN